MLIKSIFLFLVLNDFFFISSSNHIQSKWSNFEFAIKSKFEYLFDKSFSDGLKTVLNQTYNEPISKGCKASLINLVASLGQMKSWAFQMFDASAKLPAAGLLSGTVTNLGQYDECLSIRVPFDYAGQYCTLRINPALPQPRPLFNTIHDKIPQLSQIIRNADKNHSQWLSHLAGHAQYFYFTPLRFGICTPSACSSTELNQMIGFWFEKNFHLEAKIAEDGCETFADVELTKKIGPRQWISISILFTFCFIVLLATLHDILDLSTSFTSSIIFIKRLIKYFNPKESDSKIAKDDQQFMFAEHRSLTFLDCFSIQRNLKSLLNFNNSFRQENSIEVVHGLKVITMSWVVLGHTYGLINPENHRKFDAFKLVLPFLNATLSVNTFFAISGLLTFWSLKNCEKKAKDSKFFVKAFLYRQFRLLPPYIGLLCATFLFNQIRSGPLWLETVQKPVISNCEYSIWPNLLFINNFFNTRQMCLMHTWYLSVDVQFFAFSLLLFFIYLKNSTFSFSLMIISSVVAMSYSLIATYVYNYPPTILATAPAVTERWNYILDFYYKPWVHLSSYLIGSYFGVALYSVQTGAGQSWLHKIYCVSIFRSIMNLLMALLGLLTLFSIWPWNSGVEVPQFLTALYASTFRFCWSLSLLWFVFTSTIERSGLIYEFLVWPGWLPVSRITYSAFLFHPLVIWVHFGTIEHSLSYNHQEFIRMFTSNIFLSIVLALISSLIFEAPIVNMQKLIFKDSKKSSPLDGIKFNNLSNSNELTEMANRNVKISA